MNFLENRFPPPLVALTIAILMWLAVLWLPATALPRGLTYTAAAIVLLAGLAFSIRGVGSFRRAGTTVNPIKIENASHLVTGGIYGISRNPMYVGVTLVLCAWAFFLGVLWTLIGPAIFVAYTTRFQIIPEERILATKFGDSYRDYCRRVRRWL
jgi:protein-S-isoprenylcysteine O-methyltransferase Ste14